MEQFFKILRILIKFSLDQLRIENFIRLISRIFEQKSPHLISIQFNKKLFWDIENLLMLYI